MCPALLEAERQVLVDYKHDAHDVPSASNEKHVATKLALQAHTTRCFECHFECDNQWVLPEVGGRSVAPPALS